MKRKNSPGCKCCCDCVDVCGCYQFLEDYLSPNVAKTELTITGYHPAHLVAYIEYYKSYYDALDEVWRCSGWLMPADKKCCIGGSALVDREESDDVSQLNFCCQSTSQGTLEMDQFQCCTESTPGGQQQRWIKVREVSFSGKVAKSTTWTHAVWYRKLAVRMYAGEQDGCCGVFVEVCLSFRRFFLNTSCGSQYSELNVTQLCPDPPCGGVVTDPPCEEQSGTRICSGKSDTCGEDVDPESGAVIACPAPLDAEDYIVEDDENQNDSGLHYSILRRKFVSGDPACSHRNIPVLNVTLSPEDNVATDFLGLGIGVCDVCPADQESSGVNEDYCIADYVYYDRGTYEDVSEECCDPPSEISCGGTTKVPGFDLLACAIRCDETTLPSLFPGSFDYIQTCENSGDLDLTNFSYSGIGCYTKAISNPVNVFVVTSRTHTLTEECSIDTCGHLLFGELDDTWELTISLPS